MINQEELKKHIRYDPITGHFWWKQSKRGRRMNQPAGSPRNYKGEQGYIFIGLNEKYYQASHLANLYMTGRWPTYLMDHKDHNKQNNKWKNLRQATHLENSKNHKKSIANKSSVTGVTWDKQNQKWHAHITVMYRRIHLGFHIDFHKAVAIRKAFEVFYDFHPNHGK